MSNTTIVQLFPGNPLQANELFDDVSNKVVSEGDFIISASDMSEINEVEDDARTQLIATQSTNMIIQLLDASGYENPLETDADVDMCLITEAIISLLNKYNGKDHPLQEVAARTISIDEEDFLSYEFDWNEEGFFKVTIVPTTEDDRNL